MHTSKINKAKQTEKEKNPPKGSTEEPAKTVALKSKLNQLKDSQVTSSCKKNGTAKTRPVIGPKNPIMQQTVKESASAKRQASQVPLDSSDDDIFVESPPKKKAKIQSTAGEGASYPGKTCCKSYSKSFFSQ